MKKIVLLTNILTPYRKAFYDGLYAECLAQGIEFCILVMSETESERRWKYEEYSGKYTQLLKKKVYLGKTDSLYSNPDLIDKLEELNPDYLILSGSYTLLPVWKALKWGKKHNCELYFWSESHLNESRKFHKLTYLIREVIRKKFYKQFSGFWYPGEKAKQLIDKYARSDIKYIQVPNLIDNTSFSTQFESINISKQAMRSKYGINVEKLVFFSAIRLTEVKGMIPFLEALPQNDSLEKLQIVIAGEGELEQEIREYSIQKGIDVKLLGYKNEEEIIELLYAADWFLLPSLSDPNPLTCIEALWCKKPLFVSEHVGNYPEVVKEGINGFVFSYGNEKELHNKYEMACSKDEDWYKNAAAESEKIAKEKFDVQTNCRRIINTLCYNEDIVSESVNERLK